MFKKLSKIMAKENKKEMTVDNVVESINEGRLANAELMASVSENIAKKRKEELTKALEEIVERAEWQQADCLLGLKKSRELEAINLTRVKKRGELLKELGEGKYSPEEYKEKSKEIDAEFDKAYNKIDADFATHRNKMDAKFTNGYAFRHYRW